MEEQKSFIERVRETVILNGLLSDELYSYPRI